MITRDCPRCEAPAASLLARDGGALKCSGCGLLFDPMRVRGAPERKADATIELRAPAGFEATLRRNGTQSTYRESGAAGVELELVRRWLRTSVLASVLLVIAVIGGATAIALGLGLWAFPELFVIGGAIVVIVLYGLAASLLNATRIRVAGGVLSVEHGPIPWPGNVAVDATRVTQVFCVSVLHQRQQVETFNVEAQLAGAVVPTTLVSGLELPDHALFLEHAIERALGIEDRPVIGELPKNREAP